MISNNPYRTIGVDVISKYLCEIFRVYYIIIKT